jgi:hypothetical protein
MAGVTLLSRGSPASTEGGLISKAYNALETDKERVDFLVTVLTTLKDRADSVFQQAVSSAQGASEQYAWARRQTPPIDLDRVATSQDSLPRWLALTQGADKPPADIERAVQNNTLDGITAGLGMTTADVLPVASEPRGGRRYRKTRKSRKGKKRSTRKR